MSFYVLVPGAGGGTHGTGTASYPSWPPGPTTPPAVDLPGADPGAGLAEYASAVLSALDDHRDAILVAQSLAGFTAPPGL